MGRLASYWRPLTLIWISICFHWDTLKNAVRKDGISALARPQLIRDAASAKLLSAHSAGFIAFEDTTIVPSLVKAARGVVLELGPGPGNQIHRYETSVVDFVYAVDPVAHHYQNDIAAKLANHSLRDRYKLITCGIEDSDILRSAGVVEGSMDTVLSIQVLCAINDPKLVMKEIYKLLKPGGRFIFWEHGWSKDPLTIATQAVLNPAWSTFVGCRLTRNVKADILGAGEWENPGGIEEPVDPHSCLPRIQGVLIKKA
ncbi:methyltransferase type 11 [Truncatella angustata]|uniref:Methyltransferase type 11 n=1 Tax=Truncatella angustata TaxID=152316 RepID=A0A9P8RL65_9PEZI|nr:methyltransferase type 11 [Truncatella angustata]KAH6645330.1 methyltransferase type 11 [Truncatella angustata]